MDLMFKATDKPAWDAWAETALAVPDVLIDEIGPIGSAAGEMGEAHYVNVRVLRPVFTSVDDQGNVTETDVCAELASGGAGVEWIDPASVSTPSRIWAGGMCYWVPNSSASEF